jgi:hypothetical protein
MLVPVLSDYIQALETDMFTTLAIALFPAALIGVSDSPPKETKMPDKIIQIERKDENLVFIERGEEKSKLATLVVGQSLRFSNLDTRAHTISATLMVEEKPLFRTGVIEPGEHKDILLDIHLYRRAGGKPASVVTIKYQCDEQPASLGELQLLSAAKRGLGRR